VETRGAVDALGMEIISVLALVIVAPVAVVFLLGGAALAVLDWE
jgi:hypothetical protein